ncbi:hypothetical protein PRBRB14_14420 [Hallella multisaccharivorax DSM 17128]|uniref:AAA family ATPase n=1 Tax=Hallella multisaccharivorax TaxID=310514 RepID=UPI001CC6B0F4|nr:hypothetical protein [Hallella multisaccharivorax]GJG30563.1 hypothetical protein PRBRB14_14420 [Hallella multisaccharivorax DSM 17128]
MLQQFIVENFLSFKNREIFSLQPSKGTLKKEHKIEPIKGQWVLKSAAMFGANAGGKSNFVKAIDLGKKLVLRGTRTGDLIDFYPFRLSSENKKRIQLLFIVCSVVTKSMNMGLATMQSR